MSGINLQGKVALITGSSRGIGRAIAERLAAAGADIAVNYTQGREAAAEVVATVERLGAKAVAFQADVSKTADVHRLFEEASAQFGHLDIVVSAAGIIVHKPFGETTEEDFDRLFNINAKGTFFVMQEAAKRLADGGRIIAFSSTLTSLMAPGFAAYNGTKGAVEQFVRSLAKELGKRKITVNAVAPGPVETDMITKTESRESLQFLAGLSAFARLGQPDEIADVVAFLASDAARWVSGQTVRVNGAVM
jgi:3-oxoacyl-[acyl-carrier protein] reductase